MTREPIFDSYFRTDAKPSLHTEETFTFWNRVAGEYWSQGRDLVEGWAGHISDDNDYLQLRMALRSGNDEQFRSAFFEIYLHELFVRGGYDVEVHPRLEGRPRRPDFLISRGDESFYVEAKVPGSRPELRGPAHREADVLDAINGVDSPNFLLSLYRFDSGDRSLNTRGLRKDLRKWLSQLDPDQVAADPKAEKFTWSYDGWDIAVRAIRVRAEHRGRTGRAIGIYPVSGGVVRDASILRAAVESKAGEYGDLKRPFIVAIGTYFSGSFERENQTALYGADVPNLDVDSEDYQRSDDGGFFGTSPNWRGRRVSGVLAVNQLMPYSVLTSSVVLWRHPNPEHPLPEKLSLPVVEKRLSREGLVDVGPTVGLAAHVGLPEVWPKGKPWR